MAKQESILPISGTIQKLTFYKTGDGFMVKEKPVVSADKIANSATYARTRENMAEFTRAGEAGGLVRKAFGDIIGNSKDRRLPSRMTTEMHKVVISDATSDRGQRNVTDGEAALLTGFQFNARAVLSATFRAPFTAAIDRATGIASVDIPAFVPANLVAIPKGATHFQLFIGVAAIDFEAATYKVDNAVSQNLAYNDIATAPISLKANFTINSTQALFLAFGIEFMEAVNGKMYPLNNNSFNACSLVKVESAI